MCNQTDHFLISYRMTSHFSFGWSGFAAVPLITTPNVLIGIVLFSTLCLGIMVSSFRSCESWYYIITPALVVTFSACKDKFIRDSSVSPTFVDWTVTLILFTTFSRLLLPLNFRRKPRSTRQVPNYVSHPTLFISLLFSEQISTFLFIGPSPAAMC